MEQALSGKCYIALYIIFTLKYRSLKKNVKKIIFYNVITYFEYYFSHLNKNSFKKKRIENIII